MFRTTRNARKFSYRPFNRRVRVIARLLMHSINQFASARSHVDATLRAWSKERSDKLQRQYKTRGKS